MNEEVLTAGVTVVTVTYNNREGLIRTLESLRLLEFKPAEIIVIDGGSEDGTAEAMRDYAAVLENLRFISERDNGIYDAMNKGRALATHPLIHYLNAGDSAVGEPYLNVHSPLRLPVEIQSPESQTKWHDFIKLRGFGYCHQGLIFPRSHGQYDERYEVAGDLDVIMRTFPRGLAELPVSKNGEVRYFLGGVSSQHSLQVDREVVLITARNRGAVAAVEILFLLALRRLFPRPVRRIFAGLAHRLS